MDGYKRVFFVLEQDADGYPPAGMESIWARSEEGTDCLILDNTPFFATHATLGDTVEVAQESDFLRYERTVASGGNSLIRVAYYEGTDPAEVRKHLEEMGCSTELLSEYSLVSVSVPPNVKLAQVQSFLQKGAAEEKWDYEEPLLRQ